jgi:hypothetical protein
MRIQKRIGSPPKLKSAFKATTAACGTFTPHQAHEENGEPDKPPC